MKPNKAQQQAIDHIYGPLLVIAGPGTGKTQLLSSRVANILQQTDTNPENILCLTFTESGASNMRTRLATIIGRASARVHIHTYHSFGRTVLDVYQHYAATPLRQHDRPIDDVTTYEMLSAIEDSLPRSDILSTAKISDLASTIKELKSARLRPADTKLIAETNLAASDELDAVISPLLASLVPRRYAENLPIYTEILAQLTTFTSTDPIAGTTEPEANFLARSLSRILEEQSASAKPSIAPLSRWKDTFYEKAGDGSYRSRNFISNRKLLSISHIYEQYEQQLLARGLFDYADMIEQAISYLESDPGFRLALSEKYQFILLDEFQDTNPSQFQLVKSLTTYDQPNVMAVGDDDQAIMEFQGADASNLLTFQNHYGAKVITLTENYRSTQPILDLALAISAQIPDSFSRTHAIDKSLIAKTTARDTSITRHHFTAAPSEYAWLASQIADLIGQGTPPSDIAILTPKHKYIRDLLPHLAARAIPVSYEKREDILQDPAIASLILLADFVESLATGKPTLHLLMPLLSAPHWQLPPVDIIKTLAAAKDTKDPIALLTSSTNQTIQSLATFLAHLATLSPHTPLELMLDYMLGTTPLADYRSPFLAYYTRTQEEKSGVGDFSETSLVRSDDASASLQAHVSEKSPTPDFSAFALYEHLTLLRETVLAHTTKDTLRLSDLTATIASYQRANQPIANTSPYQTSADSVQILTVHKAKGLEFQHVFMLSVDDAAWGNATGNNNFLTLPKNLESIRHTGITESERLRLLFVALTRAKTHITMTSSQSDFSGKTFLPLQYLDEHDGISPLLPQSSQQIISHTDETPALQTLQHHWSAAYWQDTPDLRLLLKSRLGHYRLTPTDLTTFCDIQYAGPITFYTQRILGAPRDPATTSQLYGNLVHATLDAGTKDKSLTDADLIGYYEAELAKLDLPADQSQKLLEQGTTNLPAILQKLGVVFRSPTSVSEVNFRPDSIALDGIPITGKIDLLLAEPTTKEITIVDYKTSAYDPKKSWTNNTTLCKYALQLGFYKLLIEHSNRFGGYKVTAASLEHLTPTPRGELISRPYTFREADEQQLRTLIPKVYTHITTLDFLDHPHLSIPPDPDRTIRDLRTFLASL